VSTRPGFEPRYALAFVLSVITGGMVAVQSRINGELGLALGDGYVAALFSFSSGFLVLTVAMAANPKARAGFRIIRDDLVAGRLPWWAVTGGVGGGFLVLTQGLSAGILGVALFTVAVVTGQAFGAVAIDTRGWFGILRVRLTSLRVVGAILTVVGAVVALDFSSGSLEGVTLAFVLPMLAGLGTGYQQAVNGRIKRLAGSAVAATFVNFAAGTIALAVVTAVALPFTGGPSGLPDTWWVWTGGLVGTVFIAIQATTVGIIGVLGLGVSLVTGQLLGSIALDVLVPVAASGLSPATVIGAFITLVGSVLVSLGRRT
jgi:bacterial/archaeal transporter family-2 protein